MDQITLNTGDLAQALRVLAALKDAPGDSLCWLYPSGATVRILAATDHVSASARIAKGAGFLPACVAVSDLSGAINSVEADNRGAATVATIGRSNGEVRLKHAKGVRRIGVQSKPFPILKQTNKVAIPRHAILVAAAVGQPVARYVEHNEASYGVLEFDDSLSTQISWCRKPTPKRDRESNTVDLEREA